MACDVENVKKYLIEPIIKEAKLTDGTVQLIQKGFSRAMDEEREGIVKQALEYRLVDKKYYGRVLRDSILTNNLNVLAFLTIKNPEKEYYNAYKRTLQMAAEEGCLEPIQFLVSCGVDIYVSKEPLNLAVRYDNIEIVRYMVKNGADINVSLIGCVNKSLMDYFIKKQDDEMIRYLIEHGFRLNGESRRYKIAVELVQSENLDYLECILENAESDSLAFRRDILDYALCQENAKFVRYILEKGSPKDQHYYDRTIRNSVKDSINLKQHVNFLKGCGVDVSGVMRR